MSRQRNKIVIIFIALALVGCGFQPLYSQRYQQGLTVDLSTVTVEVTGTNISSDASTNVVPRRYGEQLKAEIESQIHPKGTSAEKLFSVQISYREQQSLFLVNPDGTASRGDVIFDTSYRVVRILDQAQVANGTILRTSSFNASPTADYASYVSIEDARRKGIAELAQDYKLRLASLLPTLNNPKAKAAKDPRPQPNNPAYQPISNYEAIRERQ